MKNVCAAEYDYWGRAACHQHRPINGEPINKTVALGAYRRISNFASNSKPQSQSHSDPRIPILNLKRKRDYGFLPELPANAKPHLDVGPDLDENSKPHKIKRLKIIPPKKPPNSYSVTSIWLSFDALVEVASLEVENFDKFARLMQEKALKKPIFVQEKVKSVAIQKRPRFGHDDDDQDWGLELETKKQRAMVVQEKGLGLEAKKKKQSSTQIKKAIAGPHPPPILPPEFKDVINTLNGRDELLIFNDIVLIQWDMPKITGNTSSTYALRTGWNNVRKSNDLKEGDLVQLWSLRVGQQACEDALLLLL
ncbi:b3 domain-containing protein [Quercus suber]|uniref:B3 domain-containing protein n=1 Tax=Quercus suber TaxID=58331 RepID=A0AAW0KQ32_QUESU